MLLYESIAHLFSSLSHIPSWMDCTVFNHSPSKEHMGSSQVAVFAITNKDAMNIHAPVLHEHKSSFSVANAQDCSGWVIEEVHVHIF